MIKPRLNKWGLYHSSAFECAFKYPTSLLGVSVRKAAFRSSFHLFLQKQIHHFAGCDERADLVIQYLSFDDG